MSALLAVLLTAAAAHAEPAWERPEDLGGVMVMEQLAAEAQAQKQAQAEARTLELGRLMSMSRADLESLYRRSLPGPMPDGEAKGAASLAPGRNGGAVSSDVMGLFWRGKIFDRASGTLTNRILGMKLCKAKVYPGQSWLDGKPSIIIDYKGTCLIASGIRDEIRLVAPGLYLGYAYTEDRDGNRAADIVFALDFNGR